MDKKLKSDWIAALRSGKYEQGHEMLQANGKFCCLGFLCHNSALMKYNGDSVAILSQELNRTKSKERLPKWRGVEW